MSERGGAVHGIGKSFSTSLLRFGLLLMAIESGCSNQQDLTSPPPPVTTATTATTAEIVTSERRCGDIDSDGSIWRITNAYAEKGIPITDNEGILNLCGKLVKYKVLVDTNNLTDKVNCGSWVKKEFLSPDKIYYCSSSNPDISIGITGRKGIVFPLFMYSADAITATVKNDLAPNFPPNFLDDLEGISLVGYRNTGGVWGSTKFPQDPRFVEIEALRGYAR